MQKTINSEKGNKTPGVLDESWRKAPHRFDGRSWDETDKCVQCGKSREDAIHATMIEGKFDPKKSWEKQSVYNLENGVSVTAEYNQTYGVIVSKLEDHIGSWHCSEGLAALPERFNFALSWCEQYAPQIPDKVMRPRFITNNK